MYKLSDVVTSHNLLSTLKFQVGLNRSSLRLIKLLKFFWYSVGLCDKKNKYYFKSS